ERRLDLLAAPAAGGLRKIRDRHGRVALRKRRLGLRRRRRVGLLRLSLLLRLGLGGCTLALRAADRLDLDAREPAAVTRVLLVPGAAAVLADADLLAELVPDHASGHGRRRREIGCAVAADEQDTRFERRALVLAQAVDEQPLALTDAVLLAAETDDRV